MIEPQSAAFRSLLFMPGTRPELLSKAPRWRPDAVVLDLEDAVAPDAKAEARAAVVNHGTLRADGSSVLVRVNAPGSPWFEDDLRAVAGTDAAGLVLPKAETPESVYSIAQRLTELSPSAVLVVGIETARGADNAKELLGAGATAAYFGAEDFIADMGGRRSNDGLEVLYARSRVAIAGRLAGVPVIDQAVVNLDDDDGFLRDAEQGRGIGYVGKICIHPRQVALCHRAFTPTAAEVEHAGRVVRAVEQGVGVVDGSMVDGVHLRLAHHVLARAASAVAEPSTTEESP